MLFGKNIGERIKEVAEILCVVGVCTSILIGIYVIAGGGGGARNWMQGIFIIVWGAFGSYVLSLLVAGFGQRVVDCGRIAASCAPKEESAPEEGTPAEGTGKAAEDASAKTNPAKKTPGR